MNDRLVEDYRDVVTSLLLNDPELPAIFGVPKNKLLWTRVFPQQYIPSVVTDAASYIFFDIDESVKFKSYASAGTYVEVSLYFWVMSHKQMRFYKERLKDDVLSYKIKSIFGKCRELGIAPAKFMYDKCIKPDINDYSLRKLMFDVTDWGDNIRRKYEEKY